MSDARSTPQRRAAVRRWARAHWADSAAKARLAEAMRLHWSDPEARARHVEAIVKGWTPERRAAHGEKMRAVWAERLSTNWGRNVVETKRPEE